MIDDSLVKICESDLNDYGSLTVKRQRELLANYKLMIESDAELRKENQKLKAL